jgi:hypothetical protein
MQVDDIALLQVKGHFLELKGIKAVCGKAPDETARTRPTIM